MPPLPPQATPLPRDADIPLEDWIQIFMAFTVEHLRAFPKDAWSMPGHVDLIIKMKATNMLWLKYDTLVCQKRAKRIARGSRKIKSWASTDVILYLACQPPRLLQKPKTFSQRPSMGPPTGQSHHQCQPVDQQTQGTQLQLPTQGGIPMQSGTCWRFQSAKGCDGTCLWPHTHQCYSCGRDHSTRTWSSRTAWVSSTELHHTYTRTVWVSSTELLNQKSNGTSSISSTKLLRQPSDWNHAIFDQ